MKQHRSRDRPALNTRAGFPYHNNETEERL
nr:MAG TPA: hypothetical protein [Caudoviricetes sp.]